MDPNLFVDTSGDISMRSLGMGRSEVDESEVRPLSLGVKLAYNMAFLILYARIFLKTYTICFVEWWLTGPVNIESKFEKPKPDLNIHFYQTDCGRWTEQPGAKDIVGISIVL